MSHDYEIVEKRVPYQGFFNMEVYRLRHRLFAGGWTPVIERECLERGNAVAVLPYDPVRDRLVLVEQFRIGALDSPGGPWLLEIVAGMVKPDEAREEVVHREAQEEAGCELQDLVHVCDYLVSPGGTSESVAVYCGRVDTAGAGGIYGLDEEHEDIRVHVYDRAEALELLRRGRIVSATPIIALQWLALNWQKLRTRWTAS